MNRPVPFTQTDLADLLADMAARVRDGDSFEGSIEYSMPDPDDGVPEGTYAMVRAAYRHGNRQHGQGFMRIVGAS